MTAQVGNIVRFNVAAMVGEGLKDGTPSTLNSNAAMVVTAIDGDQATVSRQGVVVQTLPAKFLTVEAP